MFRKDYKVWIVFFISVAILFLAVFANYRDFYRNYIASDSISINIDTPVPVLTKVSQDSLSTQTWLGIEGIDVTDAIAGIAGLKKTAGVFITKVMAGSPAALASDGGLKKEDVIVKFDRRTVKDVAGLKSLIAGTQAGDIIRIEAVREGDKAAYYTQMELRPSNAKIIQVAGTSGSTQKSTSADAGSVWPTILLVLLALMAAHYIFFRPQKIVLKSKRVVQRFTAAERLMHLLLLLGFLTLTVTGFALYSLDSKTITALDIRDSFIIIHVVAGAVFAFSLLWTLVRWLKHAYYLDAYDINWLKNFGGYLSRERHKKHLPQGKFNAGQKIFFWLLMLIGTAVAVTGFIIIINNPEIFTGKTIVGQFDYNLHIALAYIILILVMIHFYLVVFLNPGVVYSMLLGYVFEEVAEAHSLLWIKRKRRDDGMPIYDDI
ncbi:MAG: cytochrome b/b6 domain-containing protein [Deltaproteobacteria bacterium]|nr:cytochrome b/b6 domain-containing protein [Deltaproteobacteria bacterium]